MAFPQLKNQCRAAIKFSGRAAPLISGPKIRCTAPAPRRKVLIIEDEPTISNLLYVLLDGLNYNGEVALSGKQALQMIGRDNFDAVLLDLRYSSLSAEQMVLRITKIRPSLVGRVLVVTGQVANSDALALIEHQYNPHVKQNRLMEEVHRSLLALWAIADLPEQVSPAKI
jgi:CheY-like chemotaxis protein